MEPFLDGVPPSHATALEFVRLAMLCGRPEDVCAGLRSLVVDASESSRVLPPSERALLAQGFKARLSSLRGCIRMLALVEQHEDSPVRLSAVRAYAREMEDAIMALASTVLSLVADRQIPVCEQLLAAAEEDAPLAAASKEDISASSGVAAAGGSAALNSGPVALRDALIWYYKLTADWARYVAETHSDAGIVARYSDVALAHYSKAAAHAASSLNAAAPARLGVLLNFTVFLFEVRRCGEEALELADAALSDARAALDADDAVAQSTAAAAVVAAAGGASAPPPEGPAPSAAPNGIGSPAAALGADAAPQIGEQRGAEAVLGDPPAESAASPAVLEPGEHQQDPAREGLQPAASAALQEGATTVALEATTSAVPEEDSTATAVNSDTADGGSDGSTLATEVTQNTSPPVQENPTGDLGNAPNVEVGVDDKKVEVEVERPLPATEEVGAHAREAHAADAAPQDLRQPLPVETAIQDDNSRTIAALPAASVEHGAAVAAPAGEDECDVTAPAPGGHVGKGVGEQRAEQQSGPVLVQRRVPQLTPAERTDSLAVQTLIAENVRVWRRVLEAERLGAEIARR